MTILSFEQCPVLPGGDVMCQTASGDSAATVTHAKTESSSGYQRARVNVYINPAQRQQLDAFAAEWGVPVTEAFRRVLDRGLRGVMLSFPNACNGERRDENDR